MSEWRECKLGEIAEIFDGPHATPKKTTKGEIFLGISNINNGRIDTSALEYLSEEDYKRWTKRVEPRENDILFSYETKLGEAAIIPEGFQCCLGRRMGLLRPKLDYVEPKFLLYYYLGPEFQTVIKERTVFGTTVDRIPLIDLPQFPVYIPLLPEQRAIASVLSCLDDKIDLLRRENKTLEAMAETLFRQWFVEKVDENTIGKIVDLVDFNPSRRLSKGTVAPYLEMANVSSQFFCPDEWYYREYSSGMKFINGDTLFARITPCLENGKSAFVTFLEKDQVGWGSTEFIVMRSKGNLHPLFSYALVRNKDFRDYAESCLAGSSGRQRIEIEHLMDYEIAIPTEQAILEFNQQMSTIAPKLHGNFLQIHTLEKTRNLLLPKLMTGAIRVEA